MRLEQVLGTFLAMILGFVANIDVQGQTGEAQTKGAIVGTVSNQDGRGIASVEIVVVGDSGFSEKVSTDGQGLYAVTDLPPGLYTISAVAQGTKVLESRLVLNASQVVTFGTSVALQASSTNIKGTLTGAISDEKGVGVAGAVVRVDNGAGIAQSVTADGQGLYATSELPGGTYAISITSDGKLIFQTIASLSGGEVLTLNVSGPLVPQTQSVKTNATLSPVESSSSVLSLPPAVSMPVLVGKTQSSPSSASQVSGGGSITGTVTDQTGAVVVGATVKITSTVGVVLTTVSDEKGNYLIKGLPTGSYHITISAQGFKTFDAEGVALAEGQSLPLDAALEPPIASTEVNVQGQKVAQVETENAQVQGVITEKETQTLQLNGRNFTQLIALTPGVSNQTGQDEAKVGVVGSVRYSVNGGRVEYNTFEVDGGDVLNAGLNGSQSTLQVYPSLDAIQEVKVLTSNYGAMYGRTASGTVLVTTKSGTAHWRGSAYEFFRNEAFNARNYFDQTKSAPLYRRNDFGFTIGGPLYIPGHYNVNKDKTFLFFSEEFRIEKSPSDLQPNFNQGVPSLAERQGDFNDVCPPTINPDTGAAFQRSQYPDCPSFNITNGLLNSFPGNNISTGPAVLDTNALAILSTNLIPLANANTGCNSSIGSCYVAVISEPTHWREELFRIDHNITRSVQATFRYIHDSWDTVTPVPQWSYLQNGLNLRNSFPTVQNKFVGPGISLVARVTATITPTLLNELTASYTNSHITLSNVNGPGGANYQRPSGLGMPGGLCSPQTGSAANVGNFGCLGAFFNNGFGGKAPGIVIGGTNEAFGGGGFAVDPSYMPWDHTNPTYGLRDDVSKSIGRHTVQFGGQIVYWQRNQTNSAIGAASGDLQGLLTFSNTNGGRLNTGNAFANFLAFFSNTTFGNYANNNIQSYQQDSAQLRYYNRYLIGEPYVQDDWKIRRNLTLNLGVRFSLFGLFHEKYHNAYNWDPAHFSAVLASQLSVNPDTGQLVNGPGGTGEPIPLDLNNLDPRITNGIVRCGFSGIPDGCMTGNVFNPAPRIGIAWDPKGDGKTSIRAGYGIFFEHGTGQEANTGSLEASTPLVLSETQRFPVNYGCIGGAQGADKCITFPPGGAGPGAFPISVTAVPTHAVWSNAQQWSLSVQRELPKFLVATVAYVGSKGTHLTAVRQVNQLRPVTSPENPFGPNEPIVPQGGIANQNTLLGDCAGYNGNFQLLNGTVVGAKDPAFINLIAACEGSNQIQLQQAQTPDVATVRPYPGLDQIFSLQNIANSSYHAYQSTLRRTKGPLTVGVSYSYSHSIDDSSDRSDSTLANSYDIPSNRASSNFDQRHLLNINYIYT